MITAGESIAQNFDLRRNERHHLKERVHDFIMMPAKAKFFLLAGSIVVSLLVAGIAIAAQKPEMDVAYSATNGLMNADSNIVFSFSRPMSRQVSISIEPAIAGNWYFEDRLSRLHLSREFRFEPLETWNPDTTYTIMFDGLHNVFGVGQVPETVATTFITQASPEVISVTPEMSETLRPDASFVVALDAPNSHLATFDLVLDPEVEMSAVLNEDATVYTFTPTKALAQGTQYSATVIKNDIRVYRETLEISYEGEGETAWEGGWKTKEAPGIVDFSPTGDRLGVTQTIAINFNEEPLQDELAKITIDPALQGSWSVDGTKATFAPEAKLAYETEYTVTIPKGFTTKEAGFFEQEAVYSFSTIGSVSVLAVSPGPGASGVASDRAIRIDFDQQVDHPSAESAFSITPGIEGSFSWDGATMIFSPSQNFTLDTGYTFKLASGIKSVVGLPSKRDFAFTFTTQPTVVKLAVPMDYQDRPLSCEVAALKMALAYKGVSVSETELMSHVTYDPTPHVGNTWGNPHVGFVGDIDGKQSTTGYGVYWEPIQRAASKYREAEIFTNGAVQTLTDEISKGNPIVIWGNAGSGKRVDWYTPDGKLIIAINGEHTRTVKGYIGPKNNPTHIIVNDPLYGEITYATPTFEANWATLGKAGVIVR